MRRVATVVLLLAAVAATGAALAAPAMGEKEGGEARTIRFAGEQVRVPAGWPVIRLAERPRACVRLDRKAVYLGKPRPEQSCPAQAIGRRRAILVNPGSRASAGDGTDATASRAARPPRQLRLASGPEFTGLGFDACAAPSRRSMRAWDSSPYRAVGVYIGGLNRACSQPNLTASWVAEQVAAGWYLIPTYVGLQAPTSSCSSCARLSAGSATLQGTAAANDAVAQAQAIGIGPGSPIYNDMESYSRTSSATNATLTFLSAWTARLHALGYQSGVYSSGASGIADLVSRLGGAYLHPDHIWIANWDGRKTADDPYVPDYAWSEHQRIRQYRGGHDETWGGVAINIDNNYVEGGTVGASTGTGDDPQGGLELLGSTLPGQLRLAGWAFDPNAPRRPLSIRVFVGGKPGRPGTVRHELGAIAINPRPELALLKPGAGGVGGFDVNFATTKVGRERVCAYAVDIGPGADTLLGCRTVGVRIPLAIVGVTAARNGVYVAVRCEWPAETQCPGRIMLRTRLRVRVAGSSRAVDTPRTKLVRAALARRTFRLSGGHTYTFRAPLSRRARELTRGRDKLRAQLVVAVPDGRLLQELVLRPGRGLPG